MIVRAILFLLALLTAPTAFAQGGPIMAVVDAERCDARGVGDDPSDIVEASCRPLERLGDIRSQGQLVWLRGRIVIPQDYSGNAPLGLHLGAMAAREVFWNGERISDEKGGRPGASREAEKPGDIDTVDWIPPRLIQPGDNIIAVRLSTFHLDMRVAATLHYVFAAPLGDASSLIFASYVPGLVATGALIAAALFFGFAYLNDRRDVGSLLIAIMSLCVVGQFGLECMRTFVAYAYPFQIWRLVGIAVLAFAFALSMTAYVARRFVPGRWRVHVAVAAAFGLLVVPLTQGFDGRTLGLILAPSAVALAAAVQGLLARRAGAIVATVALVAFVALQVIENAVFLDRTFYLSVSLLALVLFFDQVRAMRRAREAEEHATRRAAMLELELLRRRVAPHFLMNTLNALVEWVESDPKTGVRMIEALAEEFRILSHVSDRPLIPLSEEIALCRRHLEVMSYRVDRAFSLSVANIDETAEVPPGVLHTLVENAFTHGRFADGGEFVLTSERDQGGERLVLITPSANGAPEAPKAGLGGEGIAYVRRRLEAAFGSGARVESGASANGWRTVLTIPRPALTS